MYFVFDFVLDRNHYHSVVDFKNKKKVVIHSSQHHAFNINNIYYNYTGKSSIFSLFIVRFFTLFLTGSSSSEVSTTSSLFRSLNHFPVLCGFVLTSVGFLCCVVVAISLTACTYSMYIFPPAGHHPARVSSGGCMALLSMILSQNFVVSLLHSLYLLCYSNSSPICVIAILKFQCRKDQR
jgi:hypothetical protein